jgi:tryptophan 2,3-dioxygenase
MGIALRRFARPRPGPRAAGVSCGAVHERALTYSSYLRLDELLACQTPLSEGPEHDELLFIVIHQVYELWFKQLLHELAHLQARLEAGDAAAALATTRRILTILKTVVAQIDVLETMTPLGFGSFRGRLESASGFQSAQFRELEAVLGRRDPSMLAPYPEGSAGRRRIAAAMARPGVFDSLLRFLAGAGVAIPTAALERDPAAPLEPSPAVQDALLAVYREDPDNAQVCERMVDIDEGIQEWRYRHVKMVERTIGARIGTGGSSGAAYLRETLFRPMFPDLWEIRSRL